MSKVREPRRVQEIIKIGPRRTSTSSLWTSGIRLPKDTGLASPPVPGSYYTVHARVAIRNFVPSLCGGKRFSTTLSEEKNVRQTFEK